MTLRFSIPDYTFPKLEWEQVLRLMRDLGIQAIDIGLFAGRSHHRPEEVLSRPAAAAVRIVSALHSHGLGIADIFGQPGTVFEEKAVNHPDTAQRKKAADFFLRFLELAARCNARHVTLLPGVHYASENYENSLMRSADELAWRVEAASKLHIVLAVEPHIGSIISKPAQSRRLIELTPALSLTLDYAHFTCQGFSDSEVEPLLANASHFHARTACPAKLQAPFGQNTIDFARILQVMARSKYSGYLSLEYVWSEWMGCNQVDTLSETITLHDFLCGVNASDLNHPPSRKQVQG